MSTLNLQRELDSAVREYEIAIMRTPTNEDEIRRCVDRCADARQKLKQIVDGEKEKR